MLQHQSVCPVGGERSVRLRRQKTGNDYAAIAADASRQRTCHPLEGREQDIGEDEVERAPVEPHGLAAIGANNLDPPAGAIVPSIGARGGDGQRVVVARQHAPS